MRPAAMVARRRAKYKFSSVVSAGDRPSVTSAILPFLAFFSSTRYGL
jgi:hypothetical protein